MGGMSGYIPTVEQVDELHRKIAPSQAAYDLIHTHCVIVATIARQLAHRQNALFMRRCTLPPDAPELGGAATCAAPDDVPQNAETDSEVTVAGRKAGGSIDGATDAGAGAPDAGRSMIGRTTGGVAWTVPPTDGVSGGTVPPRLLDEHLVLIGGLLHDIGTYRVLKKKHDGRDGNDLKFSKKRYIQHGLLGYEYLLDEGVDESIAQFARNHTGVGLTREAVVAQGLPLPPDDYVPVNLEQETVMVADKYHSKSVPPKFVSVDAYTARAARFGEDNRRRWLELVDRYGRPDIAALAERWHMRMI